MSLFVLDRLVSDNAMISIYPLGDGELYAFAETPFIHRIDKVTLDTTGRVSESFHFPYGSVKRRKKRKCNR